MIMVERHGLSGRASRLPPEEASNDLDGCSPMRLASKSTQLPLTRMQTLCAFLTGTRHASAVLGWAPKK